MYWSKTFS